MIKGLSQDFVQVCELMIVISMSMQPEQLVSSINANSFLIGLSNFDQSDGKCLFGTNLIAVLEQT
jgi:hypothetical protein